MRFRAQTRKSSGFLPATAYTTTIFFPQLRAMGFVGGCFHRRVCSAIVNLSLRRVCCGRSIGLTAGRWNYSTHLHAYLSEYGNDDLDAADYGRAAAVDQLQRVVCADDHVWTRTREQRLGPPKRSRRLILGEIFRRSTRFVNWSVAGVYFTRSVA